MPVSTLLSEDIVELEKPDGICLLTFVVEEFSGLFLHPSVISIIHSRSAYNNKWCLIRFLTLIKF